MTTLSAVRGVKAGRPSPPAGDQQTNNERPSRNADTCERCPPELTSGYGFRCGSPAVTATSDPARSPRMGCGPRGRPTVVPQHPIPNPGAYAAVAYLGDPFAAAYFFGRRHPIAKRHLAGNCPSLSSL